MVCGSLVHAHGSAGLQAWNALEVDFEIWRPIQAGQTPTSTTAQAVILVRRAVAQQQAQQMAQVRLKLAATCDRPDVQPLLRYLFAIC